MCLKALVFLPGKEAQTRAYAKIINIYGRRKIRQETAKEKDLVEVKKEISEVKKDFVGLKLEMTGIRHEIDKLSLRMTVRLGGLITLGALILGAMIKF